jgi:transposase
MIQYKQLKQNNTTGGDNMKEIKVKLYSEYTNFELANAYFNRLQYLVEYMTEREIIAETVDFWAEVDKRRGLMLRSEWLNYNY